MFQELVVEARDEHGRAAVVASRVSTFSEMEMQDQEKLSPARRQERMLLTHKGQKKLHDLYLQPERLRHWQQKSQELTSAVQIEEGRLQKLEEKREAEEEDMLRKAEEARREAEKAQTSLQEEGKHSQRTEETAPPMPGRPVQYLVATEVPSNAKLYIYTSFLILFILMALFPSFRQWAIEEVVMELVMETIAPRALEWLSEFGEQLLTHFPSACRALLVLNEVFGIWLLGGVLLWMVLRFGDVLKIVMSFGVRCSHLMTHIFGRIARPPQKK